MENGKVQYVYCGTWSLDGRGGIGIYGYDEASGAVTLREVVRTDVVAGLMWYDVARRVLYAIDERKNADDQGSAGGGRVFAFSADPETGMLTELNRVSSFGSLPAYITPDGTDKGILVCSHNSADSVGHVVLKEHGQYALEQVFFDTTIVHFPLREDGSLAQPDAILTFPAERGMYACMHSVNLAPDGRTLIACDRNHDKVYRLSYEDGTLHVTDTLALERGQTMKTGACPRYSAFHPSLPLVYVNSEYQNQLRVISYEKGLSLAETCDVTPPEESGKPFSQSDLCVSADGRYLYSLYRGIDTVGVFSLNRSGMPDFSQSLHLAGKGPRGMRLSPDGRFLLVADLDTHDITSLAVASDGTLKEVQRYVTRQHNPGNLTFLA